MKILFFDTETTGLPKDFNAPIEEVENWPRLVQLGWVIYSKKEELISRKERIVFPEGFLIPEQAINIHGITTEQAKSTGIDIQYLLKEFKKDVDDCDLIIAHNLEFDEKIIDSEFIRLEEKPILRTKQKLCTMKESVDYCSVNAINTKWPSLEELYYRLFDKLPRDGSLHSALKDAEIVSKCFYQLKLDNIINLDRFVDLEQLQEEEAPYDVERGMMEYRQHLHDEEKRDYQAPEQNEEFKKYVELCKKDKDILSPFYFEYNIQTEGHQKRCFISKLFHAHALWYFEDPQDESGEVNWSFFSAETVYDYDHFRSWIEQYSYEGLEEYITQENIEILNGSQIEIKHHFLKLPFTDWEGYRKSKYLPYGFIDYEKSNNFSNAMNLHNFIENPYTKAKSFEGRDFYLKDTFSFKYESNWRIEVFDNSKYGDGSFIEMLHLGYSGLMFMPNLSLKIDCFGNQKHTRLKEILNKNFLRILLEEMKTNIFNGRYLDLVEKFDNLRKEIKDYHKELSKKIQNHSELTKLEFDFCKDQLSQAWIGFPDFNLSDLTQCPTTEKGEKDDLFREFNKILKSKLSLEASEYEGIPWAKATLLDLVSKVEFYKTYNLDGDLFMIDSNNRYELYKRNELEGPVSYDDLVRQDNFLKWLDGNSEIEFQKIF